PTTCRSPGPKPGASAVPPRSPAIRIYGADLNPDECFLAGPGERQSGCGSDGPAGGGVASNGAGPSGRGEGGGRGGGRQPGARPARSPPGPTSPPPGRRRLGRDALPGLRDRAVRGGGDLAVGVQGQRRHRPEG